MQISGPELTALRRQVMGQDGHNQFDHRQCPNLFLNLETRPLTEQFKPHSSDRTLTIFFSCSLSWVGRVNICFLFGHPLKYCSSH